MSILRNQSLRVVSLPENIISYYEDLQADYRKFLPQMINWGQNGYMDGETVVHSEMARARAVASLKHYPNHEHLADLLKDFLDIATTVPSAYALFSKDYDANSSVRKVGKRWEFVQNLHKCSDEEFKKGLENKEVKADFDDWDKLREEARNGKKAEVIWQDLDSVYKNAGIALLEEIRSIVGFFKGRRSNYNYCYALTSMLLESYSSWVSINKARCEELEEMRSEAQEKKSQAPDLFALLCSLDDELEKKEYGLTVNIFYKSRKQVDDDQSCYFPVVELLRQDKYKPLLAEATEEFRKKLNAALRAWDLCKTLKNRTEYIRFKTPEKDNFVPFGQSGRGYPFTLGQDADGLWVETLDKKVRLKPSNYFYGLTFLPLLDDRKRLSGYQLKFCHTLRMKNGKPVTFSNPLVGVTKEIQLLRKNGKFYFYLPFELPENLNANVANFFATADKSKIEEFFQEPKKGKRDKRLPDHIRVAAFDSNISDPLAMAKADLWKGDGHGPLKVLDYGTGVVLEQPNILCSDTSLCRTLRGLVNECRNLKDAIRYYKNCLASEEVQAIDLKIRNLDPDKKLRKEWEAVHRRKVIPSLELSELRSLYEQKRKLLVDLVLKNKTNAVLSHRSPDEQQHPRLRIQNYIASLGKQIRKHHKNLRNKGYCEISEDLQLLDLKDQFHYLKNSFMNLDIKRGQKAKFKRSDKRFGMSKRILLRRHISRLIAAKIVQAASDCHVIFMEDIQTGFREDKQNSLSRLFSPGQWKKAVEEAAEKVGKGVVFVCPDGTSKNDPVTGLCGYRTKYTDKDLPKGIWHDKKKNYVYRNGALSYVDSDTSAALNVLLVGLSHSVAKYRFFVKDGLADKDEGTGKTRLKRFFDLNFGGGKVYFVEEDDRIVPYKSKKKNLYTGKVYVTPTGFLSEKQREREVEKIKHLLASGIKVSQIDVTPDLTSILDGFSPILVLDRGDWLASKTYVKQSA